MTKAVNTDSIEQATGRPWSNWVQTLDETNASAMAHSQLAAHIEKMLEGKLRSPAWWAQSIAVAYEQHIGKRLPGQSANGLFERTSSKTINKSRNAAFADITEWLVNQPNFNGHDATNFRTSETLKRSNWRCDFEDGSRFSATVEDMGNKSKVVFTHTALRTNDEADTWKAFWSETLNHFS